MSLENLICRELKRYGQKVKILKEGEEIETFAIVTPLRYKNKMYLEGTYTSLGYVDQSHYLYIGPAQYDFEDMGKDIVVSCGQGRCVVKKCEKVFFKGRPLYIWAVLQSSGEEG